MQNRYWLQREFQLQSNGLSQDLGFRSAVSPLYCNLWILQRKKKMFGSEKHIKWLFTTGCISCWIDFWRKSSIVTFQSLIDSMKASKKRTVQTPKGPGEFLTCLWYQRARQQRSCCSEPSPAEVRFFATVLIGSPPAQESAVPNTSLQKDVVLPGLCCVSELQAVHRLSADRDCSIKHSVFAHK